MILLLDFIVGLVIGAVFSSAIDREVQKVKDRIEGTGRPK